MSELDVPLVVDLDDSLLKTDTLHESLLFLLTHRPFVLLRVVLSIRLGKAKFKEQVAKGVALDVAHLPFNSATLDYVRKARESGRTIVLATAAHESIANAVSAHLRIFDQVFATAGSLNLKGEKKRVALVDAFGINGFDYVGDSRSDLAIFRDARRAILVDHGGGVARTLKAHVSFSSVLTERSDRSEALSRLLELRLAVIPVSVLALFIITGRVNSSGFPLWSLVAGIGFVSVTFFSSNLIKLILMEADRRKILEPKNPLATGDIAIKDSVLLAFQSFLIAAICVIVLPIDVFSSFACYGLVVMAYLLARRFSAQIGRVPPR